MNSKLKSIIMFGLLTVTMVCVSSKFPAAQQPKVDDETAMVQDFFEKARLIMTREEQDIFKHLPDLNAKEEFIEDFWKKRDPDPGTPANENKEEFENRIAYANKWFREVGKNRGWDTERGRILLILGFPDRREWGDANQTFSTGQLASSKRIPTEIWTYIGLAGGLVLIFEDTNDTGRLQLRRIPSNLQTAMDLAKFSLDLRDKEHLRRAFKFDIKYNNGTLKFKVPTKKIDFQEKNGKMAVNFDIIVYVYLDHLKIDEIKTDKEFSLDKDEALKMKNFEFQIPYTTQKEGKYYFDCVIEDKNSEGRYRNFANYKK